MANDDSNANPDLGTLMGRLYDVVALMECASASLDDCKNDSAIRVIEHSKAVAMDVINCLDKINMGKQKSLVVA